MKEEWRDIPGFKGLYQVSNYGKVQSLDRDINRGSRGVAHQKGRILKKCIHTNGNHAKNKNRCGCVTLYSGKGTYKIVRVSILVLTVFDRPQEEGEAVKYISGNTFDDNINNLKWKLKGKLTYDDLKEIKVLLKEGKLSINEIAKKFNAFPDSIYRIHKGTRVFPRNI